ncbi:MAG: glycoside hydrolase family 3 C-terminal domain-containing protein, partial [Verrucomicrobiota bacterium]|nr:glycoside hydrolase family 3 C-terminal domain-containing protein [Verrucomicrobiota bacterium]
WAMQQPADQVTTIFEGIRIHGAKRGYHVDWHDSNQRIAKISSVDIQGTVQAAKEYDLVVLVVGDNSMRYEWKQRTAGENLARADINLAGRQLDLVKQLHASGIPVTVVYVSGKPLCEPWIVDNIKGVIAAWEPGSFGGQAVAEIIFGDVNPSGKTPLTMPRSVGQLRMVYNHKPSQYFKKYAFEDTSPLFPFGFGLNYSEFKYTKLAVDLVGLTVEAPVIRVSVQIENLSEIAGTEVVQVYFRDRVSSVTRPVKELVGYRRVPLQAGQAKEVVFEIPMERLAFYDINMERCVEPGEFIFMVGGSSADDDLLEQAIQVERYYSY